MRIGVIKHVSPKKGFGFIRSFDLLEDVYFHFTAWDCAELSPDRLQKGDEVEFDLDELNRITLGELRATKVMLSRRPLSAKINDLDTPHLKAKHHPKAKRRKPMWRAGAESNDNAADAPQGTGESGNDDDGRFPNTHAIE